MSQMGAGAVEVPLEVRLEYGRDRSLPELFREIARAYPDKPALESEQGSVTYANLLRGAQTVAAGLRQRGLGPGDTIGILARRSVETVTHLLGVLFAGAAYLPLDVDSTPQAALVAQAEAAGLAAILCAPEEAPEGLRPLAMLPPANGPETSVDRNRDNRDSNIDAASPAYILFTSGSTGAPKGVVVPHRAIARLVLGQQYLPFGADQRYLLHSPLSFDASTLEIWAPLLHGGTLVLAPERTLALEDFPALIAHHRLTILWLSAAIFHLLARHMPQAFGGLTHLVVGGDVVSPQAVEAAYAACPGLTITNGYGPTEATTFALTYRIPVGAACASPIPIGRPIAHTTAYILDADLEPSPDGCEGQLALGGDGVALGYVNAPALTAERFLDDPFSPQADARLYLTGDRVYRDDEGLIHFRGRLDQEIKIAGHRISPYEIEASIGSQPEVRQAVVTVRGETPETRRLHALVEPVAGARLTDATLRDALTAILPGYAIPATLRIVDRLPINANGKLDRLAAEALLAADAVSVPASEQAPANDSSGIVAPAPVAKAALTEVIETWKRVLEIDDVEPATNFFDAGGDSLLLIQLHFELNRLGRGALDLMDLFSATTPKKMAALLG